ncbi:MAG: nucleotidyl transferase AbiEii/AbiGii toxin family protein [Sphaerochaeta sp.]|nr:nucleotidyl transferase AbiEii/AbiGii toxin family protein [Sphaerochaeta sp.]
MDNVAHVSQEERIQIFSETAAQMGTTSAIVEKDFWVCWVLQKLFNTESLKNTLMFKGGTSLSKVYNVIERFSEDIDLILDWNLVSSENPNQDRSKNKQDKFNKQINERYQYPRASPGPRRRCLLFRPKGRGISPCFPATRSVMEACFRYSRFVGE